jgi:hypothetical protein
VRELRREVQIAAPPERVWAVLTDFSAYPDWNPFIRRISGEAAVGARLEAHLEPPDGRGITIKPTVVRAEPSKELAWLGRFGLPWIFDGEHHFEMEERDAGTSFVQREEFSGLLVPLLGGVLGKTQRGFEQMNVALKQRVEAAPQP